MRLDRGNPALETPVSARRSPAPVPVDSFDALFAATTASGVAVLHHVYGVMIDPHNHFRLHVVIPATLGLLGVWTCVFIHRKTAARIALYAAAAAALLLFGAWLGFFEGGYNHLLKALLYGVGVSEGLLGRMYPPPHFEAPSGNLLFEGSGLLEFVAGMWVVRAWLRLARGAHGARS